MTLRSTIQHIGSRAAVVAACGVAVIGLAAPTAQPVMAAAPQFGLISQTFNVQADGTVRFRLSLPKGVRLPTDFDLAVTAFVPVTTRKSVAEAENGVVGSSVDTVTLLPLAVPRPAAGQLEFSIPVEVTTKTDEALQLSGPGLYPVAVELHEGSNVLAELHTFIHRVPSAAERPEDPLLVAIAMSTQTPVTMNDAAEVQVGPSEIGELTALADLLEKAKVSVAVRVPPSLLVALPDQGEAGVALAARLTTALERNELLSSPVLPLDASQAADAGQSALYTQWLRDGEDTLAAAASVPAQRTVVMVDHQLSEQGGVLLRNLGARLLLLPTGVYDTLPNTLGGFTDTTQLVQIQVADGTTLDATVVDRIASTQLTRVTTTPVLTAIHQVADLLAARQEVEDQGGDPRRHSVTLATPELELPSAAGFAAFTELLANTSGLQPATLDDISIRTDQLLGPEGPVVVNLPTTVDGDLQPRIALRTALGLEAASTSSMLSTTDPRLAEWTRLIDVLPTSALTDEQVQGIADGLRSEFDTLKQSVVVPAGFAFNLTGHSGSVPVTLRNEADIPLKVRVRMTSPKLIFPDGDQTVEIPPQSFQEVKINIEARTNGTSAVTLEVFTPLGDVRLAPAVPLTASITNLAGVGNLVTGAALLVLLTWWVRHFRRNQRARRAAEAAHRHPASAPPEHDDANDPADTSGLSPDAATSTLPPL